MVLNNRLITLLNLIIFVLVLSPLTRAEIEPKNIVGIWLFDQGEGKVARDSSDNGIDGKINGNIKWVDGKFGKALLFPGVNQNFVEVPHDDSLNLTSFSFSLWLKIEDTGNYQAPFIKTADGQLENYSAYIMKGGDFGGKTVFWTRFTSGGPTKWGFQKFGTTILTDEKWHHLAGTYDMKSVKSYVDGVMEAEALFEGKPDFSPGSLNIGDCPGFPYSVKGIIDEVALFNIAFDEKTINTIMTEGLEGALAISSEGKLASVWANIKTR